MRNIEALGLLLLFGTSGCVAIDDRTPSTLTRSKDNRYTFAVHIESLATEPRTVTAAVGASEFPLTHVGGGQWEGRADLGPCAQGFQVRYLVRYPTFGDTLATSVEPAGATATMGGLLKWVLPEPEGLAACARRSVFRVNDSSFSGDTTLGDGICDANPVGSTAAARCTLTAAMMESNSSPGPATIEIPAGRYGVTESIYTRDDVVLQGIEPGAVVTTHLSVTGTTTAELRNLTLERGVRGHVGSLRLTNVSVLNNSGSEPFGVRALGLLVIERSTISGNAGIGVDLQGARAVITDSLIAETVRGSGFSGGIQCASFGTRTSELELVNSTITGNRGTFGGVAVHSGCDAKLRNVTIAGNENSFLSPYPTAGGLTVHPGGSVRLANSVVAENINTIEPANSDCVSSVPGATVALESWGHNLIGQLGSCRLEALLSRPDFTGLSAGLGPLADNGGPTQTLLPSATSPLLGAGSPDPFSDVSDAACPPTDQRGEARTAVCDIGAVEASP